MTDAKDNDISVKKLPAEIPGEMRFLWSRLVTDRSMVLKNVLTTKKKKQTASYLSGLVTYI